MITTNKPKPIVQLPDGQLQCMICENVWPNEAASALEDKVSKLTGDLAIMARACENWRTFPGQAESDHDHPDWKAAARALIERDAFHAALLKISEAGNFGEVWQVRDFAAGVLTKG